MTDTPTFEQFSPDDLKDNPLFKTEVKQPDEVWTQRIATIGVGGGFRAHRTEGESVRQLKRRINAAAGSPAAGFKTLEWKPESKNLPDGQPASYLVRVKAINLTEKAAYEKAQSEAGKAETSQNGQEGSQEGQQTTPEEKPSENGQEGSQEGQQTTPEEKPSDSPSENEPAQIGRRRG